MEPEVAEAVVVAEGVVEVDTMVTGKAVAPVREEVIENAVTTTMTAM